MRFRYDHSLDFFLLARYGFAFFFDGGVSTFAYSCLIIATRNLETQTSRLLSPHNNVSFQNTLIFYLQGKLYARLYPLLREITQSQPRGWVCGGSSSV